MPDGESVGFGGSNELGLGNGLVEVVGLEDGKELGPMDGDTVGLCDGEHVG